MKRLSIILAALIAAPVALVAQEQDAVMIEDTDNSGDFSLAELQTYYPALTEDLFVSIDADGDGAVSEAELDAARTEGVLG